MLSLGAVWMVGFLLAVMRISVPYVMAALGGTVCERAGVINIALEAFLLLSALGTALGAPYGATVALTCGLAAGLLAAALGVAGALVLAKIEGSLDWARFKDGLVAEIEILGERRKATMVTGALWDGDGARMRG